MTARETYTIWVCVDCMQHAANGECGGCDDEQHDRPPLGLLDGVECTLGLIADEHECDPDGPLCECEDVEFSWHQCEGCGSTLGGSRHAMTVWEVATA